MELFERAAYFGMYITLMRYLNQVIGFTDQQCGLIIACFSGVLYFLPTFTGIWADQYGYRRALMIAFGCQTLGYTFLWLSPDIKIGSYAQYTPAIAVLLSLTFIMIGSALVKPVISGTAAKSSSADNRARAMSIFYMVVNIGAFSGKMLAGILNEKLGLQHINLYAAGMAVLAWILAFLMYKDLDRPQLHRRFEDVLEGLWKVLCNFRFMMLIFIVACFWAIQQQMYASLPTYIERLLGKGHKPEWLANINPLVVVIAVIPLTHLMRRVKPETSIGVGIVVITFSTWITAMHPWAQQNWGDSVNFLWRFPISTLIMIVSIGIAFQGLSECFLQPRFLEYVSKQAPPGEEGMYLGYQNLTSFFANFFAFSTAGFLLNRYCPDPQKLPAEQLAQWQQALAGQNALPSVYAHAHYLWFFYVGVGIVALGALLVFKCVTTVLDKRQIASA